MTTFTAWLTNDRSCLDGAYCDLGITDEDGGRPVMYAPLHVRHDGDDDEQAADADAGLETEGWSRVSDWQAVTTGYTAEVVKIER